MENNIRNKVRRGEIYLIDFGSSEGSIQNGVRPVMVVQCDEGNEASTTTIVAAMTSVIKKHYLPSHIILGDNFGLKDPTMVMLEQLKTVNQSDLQKRIGMVNSEYVLRKINIGLKKALGLWVDRPMKKRSDVRCLCGKCAEDYISDPDYLVKRLDPFAKEKQKCDKCPSAGYDYIIIDRTEKPKAEVRNGA